MLAPESRRNRSAAEKNPDVYRTPQHAATAGRETYRYYYQLRYPYDQDEWGRPTRLSKLHGRLQEAGAEVVGVAVIVDRGAGPAIVDAGLPTRALLHVSAYGDTSCPISDES